MIGFIWIANILIGFIDLLLFVFISLVLFRNYSITKAKLLKSLVLFSIFMIIYALSSIISSIYLSMNFGYEVGFPLLIVNIISVVGFILLYSVVNS